MELKQKKQKQVIWSCPGLYCEFKIDNYYFDENDEQFCLYVLCLMISISQIQQTSNNSPKMIAFKSIFLDLIERQKTFQFISECQPQISDQQLKQLPEQLLFKLRKCKQNVIFCSLDYSIGDISSSPLFSHLKIPNFYKQKKVCFYCGNVYDKIDSIRNEELLKKKRRKIDRTQVLLEMEKYKQQTGKIINHQYYFTKDNKYPSDQKIICLINFMKKQTNLIRINKNSLKNSLSNILKMIIILIKEIKKKIFLVCRKQRAINQQLVMSISKSFRLRAFLQIFQLPIVYKLQVKDKQNLIKKKQLFIQRGQSEALGLKHYLGHVRNLPYSDQGLAISKSSLELNKLQDFFEQKIRDVELMKEKMEKQKIVKIREEIQLIMCSYYGRGKQEQERLIDFLDSIKKREFYFQSEEQQSVTKEQNLSPKSVKAIQIVTDKNDFLSENQRKQKQEKEKKEIEIQETKKNFLEINSTLAQSVIRKMNPEIFSSSKIQLIQDDNDI